MTLRPLEGLVVLDEVQRRVDLFPLLRVLSDRPDHPARFLVLGSASPHVFFGRRRVGREQRPRVVQCPVFDTMIVPNATSAAPVSSTQEIPALVSRSRAPGDREVGFLVGYSEPSAFNRAFKHDRSHRPAVEVLPARSRRALLGHRSPIPLRRIRPGRTGPAP